MSDTIETLKAQEAAIREQHRLQAEGIDRHYQRMGSVAHQYWDDLALIGRYLDDVRDGKRDHWLPENRAALAWKMHVVLHEMATARNSLDMERREIADTRQELRDIRAALRKERENQP